MPDADAAFDSGGHAAARKHPHFAHLLAAGAGPPPRSLLPWVPRCRAGGATRGLVAPFPFTPGVQSSREGAQGTNTIFFFFFAVAFPSTTIQKGTASPGTPQRAPHGSAWPHYAPTLLGLPKGSSSARRPAPEPGWQPPFLPVMLPALGGLSPFPPCRKCGGAVPPACAGEAGSRALAAIPTPGACGWASPPKPASNSLRGEQRFVCKCMRLK